NKNAIGSILALTSLLAISGAGQTMVVLTGSGIDLSAGSIMSLTAILAVHFMNGQNQNIGLCFALSVAIGAALGLCNGLGVTKIRLPSMIITYAMSNVITRLQFIVTSGKPSGSAAPAFTSALSYRVFGIFPAILFYCIGLSVLLFILLRHTKFGRRLYLVGDSSSVAAYTGVDNKRVVVLTYVLAGVLYGLAGMIGAGYFTYVSCAMLDVYTMQSIVAVVIGGAALTGGKGTYFGTIAGALFMVVLNNCLAVLNVKDAIQNIIMGLVIIGVLTLYNRDKGVRQ
ncbi:MAG: ABC transporter permease, partial [Oscillospiraceae bacterium]|nr:ABC transporter permease [Oscillospiraceae bacterium]